MNIEERFKIQFYRVKLLSIEEKFEGTKHQKLKALYEIDQLVLKDIDGIEEL